MRRFSPLLLLLFFALPLHAAEAPVGKITAVTGKVKIFRNGGVRGEAAEAPGTPLYIGDVVRTAAGGRALLLLGAGDRVALEADSTLTLRARQQPHVDGGTVLFDIRKRTGVQGLSVTTATVTMGVKGTRFAVLNENGKVGVYLREGELEVSAGAPLRYRADPLQAGAEKLRRQMAADFAQTQERMRAEFEAAQEQMRQGKVDYVDQVLLRAGSFLQIAGADAWDAPIPAGLEEKLAVFERDEFFR